MGGSCWRTHLHSLGTVQTNRLGVSHDESWQSHRQMLIASLRCQKQRMAFLIVQHDENTAPKHFSKTLSEGSPQSIDWEVAQTELN